MLLLDGSDLGSDGAAYCRASTSRITARRCGNPVILGIRNDLEQLGRAFAAFGRHDAEFGQMPADGVAQHRALTHQQLSGSGAASRRTVARSILIGTNRIDGRVTASQIAAASFASFLLRLR